MRSMYTLLHFLHLHVAHKLIFEKIAKGFYQGLLITQTHQNNLLHRRYLLPLQLSLLYFTTLLWPLRPPQQHLHP